MNKPLRMLILLFLSLLLAGIAVADTEKDGFHFDDQGFLTGDENPAEEYLFEDDENGLWQYASKDLAITVTRFRGNAKKGSKKILEYCVADIHCSENSPLGSFMTEPYSRYGSNFHGVIIRDGEVLATKTRQSPEEGKRDKRPWPNLDTLAVYRDGSMRTFVSGDKTADEYLADGAVNVFAFGPWLLSDGEINPALQKKDYYPASEPRAAIGMVEPYHYIIIATCGRPDTKYAGVKLLWLAEKMKEYGCTEALNLDGGKTVVMAFNNKIILKGDNSKSERNIGSMITFGIREPEDP